MFGTDPAMALAIMCGTSGAIGYAITNIERKYSAYQDRKRNEQSHKRYQENEVLSGYEKLPYSENCNVQQTINFVLNDAPLTIDNGLKQGEKVYNDAQTESLRNALGQSNFLCNRIFKFGEEVEPIYEIVLLQKKNYNAANTNCIYLKESQVKEYFEANEKNQIFGLSYVDGEIAIDIVQKYIDSKDCKKVRMNVGPSEYFKELCKTIDFESLDIEDKAKILKGIKTDDAVKLADLEKAYFESPLRRLKTATQQSREENNRSLVSTRKAMI